VHKGSFVDRVERRAALQAARAEELAAALDRLLELRGDERALDVGSGLGALAIALAPRVREVVSVDSDEALVERARVTAPANVEALVGDGEHLPFGSFEFDLAGTLRTLHHTRRPELLVAELVRVTKPGGTILVLDQLAPVDPLAAFDLNRFERARDASTTRVLAEGDLRALFDANGLVLRREEVVRESRDLEADLDLAGCEGAERERAKALAPAPYEASLGWFVLTRP
jgi:SAM-dependent methyltransferase